MKNNEKLEKTGDIDLFEVIEYTYRNKILVLLITLIFGLVFYIYNNFLVAKTSHTLVKLKDPSYTLFQRYDVLDLYSNVDEYSNTRRNMLQNDFINIFVSNLTSEDNFKGFINKNYRNENNLQFNQVKAEDYTLIYNFFRLDYPDNLDGKKILQDYILFTNLRAIETFREELISNLNNKILKLEKNLEIAEKIQIKNPLVQTLVDEGNGIINEPDNLFYKGSEVLSLQVLQLKNIRESLKEERFEYDFIYNSPSEPISNLKTMRNTIIGLIIGFFISFFVLLIKVSIIKK